MKFKQGLAKTGKETTKALRDILVDIASETTKKGLIWRTLKFSNSRFPINTCSI